MALFILYFIGTIFSLLFWLLSMPLIACVRGNRRAPGGSMSCLILINLLVMIASLVLALVIAISANKAVAGSGWTGRCGNSMWITIGAVVSLFFAWLCYSGACCCPGGVPGRRRRDRVADETQAEKAQYRDEKTAAPEHDNGAAAAAAAGAGAGGAATGGGYGGAPANAPSPNPVGTSGYNAPQQQQQPGGSYTPQLLQSYTPQQQHMPQGGQYAAGSQSPRPQGEPFKYELPHGTIRAQYAPALTHSYQ